MNRYFRFQCPNCGGTLTSTKNSSRIMQQCLTKTIPVLALTYANIHSFNSSPRFWSQFFGYTEVTGVGVEIVFYLGPSFLFLLCVCKHGCFCYFWTGRRITFCWCGLAIVVVCQCRCFNTSLVFTLGRLVTLLVFASWKVNAREFYLQPDHFPE